MTLEQRQKYNEGCKLRMRKMRAAKKEKAALNPKTKLTATERRKKWREEKRKQRAGVTPAQKRVKEIKALQKKLRKLTPSEFSELVDAATTPRKTKYMTDRGMYCSPNSRRKNFKVRAAVNCIYLCSRELPFV